MQTATFAPNDLIVSDVQVVTRNITLAAGQALERGAVLGRITDDDKYTLSAAAATDGSEEPALVLAYDADASSGDIVVAAYSQGAFDSTKLKYGAGHDASTVEAAWRAAGVPLYVRILT